MKVRNLRVQAILHLVTAILVVVPLTGTAQRAKSLSVVIEGLRAMPAGEETSYGYIPEDGRRLFLELKRQVGLIIVDTVTSLHSRVEPSGIRARVVRQLQDRSVIIGPPPSDLKVLGYGYVPELVAEVSPGHADLLAFRVTFSLACGWSDADLYLFRLEDGHWSKLLAQVSSDYGDISAGQGYFQYRISAGNEAGITLLMTTFVQPWCTSVWHPVRYSIYRIAQSIPEAERLFSGTTDIIAIDEGYDIRTEVGGFSLAYTVENEADPASRVRETLRLNVNGREVAATRSRPGG
jgi:hypothetical protein